MAYNTEFYADSDNLTPILQRIETKLSNRYTKAQTTAAINSAIQGVTQFDYVLVDNDHPLPQEGAKGVIYLVPNGSTGANKYNEQIWIVVDGTGRYEDLGPANVDLTNYVNLIVNAPGTCIHAERDANDDHKFIISVVLRTDGGLEQDGVNGLGIKAHTPTGHQSGVRLTSNGLRVGVNLGSNDEVYPEQLVDTADTSSTPALTTAPTAANIGKLYQLSADLTVTDQHIILNASTGDVFKSGTVYTATYTSAGDYTWLLVGAPVRSVSIDPAGGLLSGNNGLKINNDNTLSVNGQTGEIGVPIDGDTIKRDSNTGKIYADIAGKVQALSDSDVQDLLALLPSDND